MRKMKDHKYATFNEFVGASERDFTSTDKNMNTVEKQSLTITQKSAVKVIKIFSMLVDYIILILSVLILVVGVYSVWDTHQVYKIASSEEYEVYKPNSTDNLSYKALRDLNKDVIGWIDVYGTKIDYPIVQGDDNAKYLNTTVLGEYSTAGSIFLDYRNKKDFSDFNNIIYGHYMAERKMFGDMEKFKDKDFFEKHKYAVIHRNEMSSIGVTFFAFIKTQGTDQTIFSPAVSGQEKKTLVQYIYDKALFSRNIEMEANQNIILLDTCDLTVTNGRYILVGVITKTVEKNPFGEDTTNIRHDGFVNQASRLNILVILCFVWVLLVFFYLTQEIIRKKKKEAKRDERKI